MTFYDYILLLTVMLASKSVNLTIYNLIITISFAPEINSKILQGTILQRITVN